MKTILEPVAGQSCGIYMLLVELGKAVDCDSRHLEAKFAFGWPDDIKQSSVYTVRGTLNLRTNTCHVDENAQHLQDNEFDSMPMTFEQAIEQR